MYPQITVAFQTDKSLSAYGSLAKKAEDDGFDGVSVYNDMLYQPAWLPLLEIAQKTKQIKLGPAAINPFTSHPINIAGNIAIIDAVSNGRAYCGFARGAWLDFVGLKPQKPIASLSEAMACVRHLLRQDKNPFEGKYFPLQGGDALRWSILRPDIPFMLGSWGKKTIAACLPMISEIKLGGTANPSAIDAMKSFLNQRKATVNIACGAVTVVDNDGRLALNRARREVALYLPVVAELDTTVTIEPDRLAGIRESVKEYDFGKAEAYISDDIIRKFALAGTPDEVTQQVLSIFEAGAGRLEFGTPHGLNPEKGLTLLGEIVLPNLHSALKR